MINHHSWKYKWGSVQTSVRTWAGTQHDPHQQSDCLPDAEEGGGGEPGHEGEDEVGLANVEEGTIMRICQTLNHYGRNQV